MPTHMNNCGAARAALSLLALCLLALGSAAPTRASAQDDDVVDPIAELKASEFLSVRDVEAHVPHGDLIISSGIVAIFPEIARRLGGVVVGDLSLEFNELPRGEDTLNLFKEMEGKSVKKFSVSRAYLQAAITGEAQVEPGTGYTTQIRKWEELTPEEQTEFEGVVLAAMSDAWIAESEGAAAGAGYGGHGGSAYDDPPAMTLRDPDEKEVFAAFWDEAGTRWDYRVKADGETMDITEYDSGVVHVQHPWSPEEPAADENVDVQSMSFHYELLAPEVRGDFAARLALDIGFRVAQQAGSVSFVCSPGQEISRAALAGADSAHVQT